MKINITPKWEGLVPLYCSWLADPMATPSQKQLARDEFLKLARFADASNAENAVDATTEQQKKRKKVSVKRRRGYRHLVCELAGHNGCTGLTPEATKFDKLGLRIHTLRVHEGHNWSTRKKVHEAQVVS